MKKHILFAIIPLITHFSICYAQGPYLVGMTLMGGYNQDGNIFTYDASGTSLIKSYSFLGGTDGIGPWGTPVEASNGLFYGTTRNGGAHQQGVLFSYNPATDTEIVLHSFSTTNDGAAPWGGLIQAKNGLLYGMTGGGGANSMGAIFSYDIAMDSEQVVYSFAGGTTDGDYPWGTPVQGYDGNLYGMTWQGGATDSGMIFSFDISTGIERDVHDFGTGDNTTVPYGSLMQASDSLLYGMSSKGGTNGLGTIFSFNISTAKDSLLYSFAGYPTDGSGPGGTLIQARNGLLYGLTGGGKIGSGTLCSYNISTGVETDIYDFGGTNGGRAPTGAPLQASDGKLYGMTSAGGTGSDGIIFSFDLTDSTYTDVLNFTGPTNGWQPNGALVEYIPVSTGTGISPVAVQRNLTVFPNPSAGQFNINSPDIYSLCPVEVYDLVGERVYQGILSGPNNIIDLSAQADGMYLVYIKTGESLQTVKVVLTK